MSQVGRSESVSTAATVGASSATGDVTPALAVPAAKALRERLRAVASDMVAGWRIRGLPGAVGSQAGLRRVAEEVAARGGGGAEHAGWVMVTLVSEYWRDALAAKGGRRLLLLPDCPHARSGESPRICGPQCLFATLAAAGEDSGWSVRPTAEAVGVIAELVAGRCEGVVGVAGLPELQKAFEVLPVFSVPIAAVPLDPSCALRPCGEQLDAERVLSFLGVADGALSPVADHLPLLRESAELFRRESLSRMLRQLRIEPSAGECESGRDDGGNAVGPLAPLEATDSLAIDFLARGGKFLRPFMALAAYDAVVGDRQAGLVKTAHPGGSRDAAAAAAVAIEVFHKASLVHDDIEDDDAMRYGRPTLHREHGIPTALNAGDMLIGLGYRIVAELGSLSPQPAADARLERDLLRTLSSAHLRLARGQGAELWWRDNSRRRLSPAEAIEIYGLKTSPAFEAAVLMGVRLAGCEPAEAGDLSGYALHIGTAFQVLNDLKDWHGDSENLRRRAGDLLAGRPTVLWALAMERLASDDADRLAALSAGDCREDDAARLQQARDLYLEADVFGRSAEIVIDIRQQALAAAAGCRIGRLRDVMEFLLDLAVPESAVAGLGHSRG